MEVLLKNVPSNLSDEGLRKELLPFLNVLGIQDWDSQKPRRRPLAWIAFLKESEGARFLNRHGKTTKEMPQSKNNERRNGGIDIKTRLKFLARLHILKTPVYAEQSNRAIDKFTLSHLKREREGRTRPRNRNPQAPALTCPIHRIACGHNMFVGEAGVLTFVQESETSVRGTAKFGRRLLVVTLDNSDERIEISYETIEDIIIGERQQTLTLVLADPPRIFARNNLASIDSLVEWVRVPSLLSWAAHKPYAAHCLVYRISGSGSDFVQATRSLDSHEILSANRYNLPVEMNPIPTEQEYRGSMASFEGVLSASTSVLPYSLVFQVQALVWNNYLHPSSGRQLLKRMEEVSLDCKKKGQPLLLTTDSMKHLFQSIPYPCSGTSHLDLDVDSILNEVISIEVDAYRENPLRAKEYGTKLPDHQTWVLRAMVTPSRVLLNGPDAESKNKILRKFSDHSNYFLRVVFCDENGQDLPFNPRISNDFVYTRYRAVLRDGIKIADRRFQFLGFSHSSLRSHSAWFQAPFIDNDMQQQNYTTILKSLGKFEDIRVPAKCAARIGQAFSETPYAVKIFDLGINMNSIPDIKSQDGQRIFSDGVGTISWDAMEIFWGHLPMRSAAPTCFQIRWAGVKGMIALDPRLTGKVICTRKEMTKFQSNDVMELGICDTSSRPLRLVLNRQMIKILEDMGTKSAWFFAQQNKELEVLRSVTAKASNTSTFLEFQTIGINMGFPKLIRRLDSMGIDYRRDVFLRSVVEHVVMCELRLLKHKARIPVSQGITLFGIMDETAFLEEGEVYVTYDKKHRVNRARKDKSLTDGRVIVTRSPALHPGDIQVVRQVTPPAGHPLLQLQNCIIFSQKGSRDLPSMLSGGDLDGDLYHIIWDPQAMPKTMFAPADYPRVLPEPLNRDVTRDDIADFFINFMKTDLLGLIATRHQILADVKDEGTLDPACVTLANMHSTAVDFSKTGIPVKINEIPKAPKTRPDFLAPAPPLKLYDRGQIDHIGEQEPDNDDEDDAMGRIQHRFHKSEKILGRLFRAVDENKIWDQNIHVRVDMAGPSVWDQFLGLVEAQVLSSELDIVYDRQVQEAWKIRNLYETSISEIMWQFAEHPRKPISEVEAFCGSILNKTGSQTRRQRDSSIKLKEEMDGIMGWIVKLIRDRGSGEDASSVGGEMPQRWAEESVELCWACVAVGCMEDTKSDVYHGTGKLQSFRAVAASCLARELDALATKTEGGSGGYVGVSSGAQRGKVVIPMR